MKQPFCQIKVIISEIMPTKPVGSNGFEIRRLITKTIEKYPQDLEIQLQKGDVVLGDHLKVDQPYLVDINIRSKKYAPPGSEVKYFSTIVGWRFEEINE